MIGPSPAFAEIYARATALHGAGHPAESIGWYDRALSVEPRHAEAHDMRGIALAEAGHLDAALASIARAIAIKPDFANAHGNHAIILAHLGQPEAALASYARAMALDPGNFAHPYNRGAVFRSLGRAEEALADYDRALALNADHADAHNNRGATLEDLGQVEAAIAAFDRAIALDPRHANAHSNRGNALRKLKRFDDALASYSRALAVDPRHIDALNNRGLVLVDLHRPVDALADFERLLIFAPDHADGNNNRGMVLAARRRHREAIADFDRAIENAPDHLFAWHNRALALMVLKQAEAAAASFDRALELDPDNADAWHNRGLLKIMLKQRGEAIASFDRALALAPDHHYSRGYRLYCRMQTCDWTDFASEVTRLQHDIEAGRHAAAPFIVTAFSHDPHIIRTATERYAAVEYAQQRSRTDFPVHASHDRIRIGYFSGDFHAHATMNLIADMFDAHDRTRFELTAFSFGPDSSDVWRTRAVAAFDQFLDVRAMSDSEVAAHARAMEIDIAIDLKGFTEDPRPGIFAERAAPVQVNFLGFPGTMAAPYIDYLIADPVIVPEDATGHYAEKIVWLPDTYQPNCRLAVPEAALPARRDFGLPDRGFVFCCFNQNYKIGPAVFAAWMDILGAAPGSVLWLWVDDAVARGNLQAEAARQGIDPARIVFAARLPRAEHLARLPLADLFLDTAPYGAHTTASDALRMGLPVLTWYGDTFASRVAASLLQAVGLPDLIAPSLNAYRTRAIALATDADAMQAVRRRLAGALPTAPLFDINRFTRHLEASYTAMHARDRAGLPPDHIHIAPLER